MVYHAGIHPWAGKVALYDENTKKTTFFKDGKAIFLNFKFNINDDSGFGCACVYLSDNYGNDLRRELLKSGNHNGWQKVQIVGDYALRYLDFISQSKFKPNDGDIVWIVNHNSNGSNRCQIWKKYNSKARMMKEFYFASVETEKDLIKIKTDFGNNYQELFSDPNLIIFVTENHEYQHELSFYKIIQMMFPGCEFFNTCVKQPYEKLALLKARILANDPEVKEYDDEMHLEEKVFVNYNQKQIMHFDRRESLPLEKTAIVPMFENEIILCVYANSRGYYHENIKVPHEKLYFHKMALTFKMDENQICYISYFFMESAKSIEYRLKKLYLNNPQFLIFPKAFLIPKKISMENENVNVIGIDLGTSRCCVAVNKNKRIEVVAIDNKGERLLPSYVAFDEKKKKCGQVVVDRLRHYAESTVYDTKRFIGKSYIEVEKDPTWPFKINNEESKVIIEIKGYANDKIEIYPEDVSAVLLKYLKEKVEEYQGKQMDEVVITVPALFNTNQKIATQVAALIANWKTVHFLPEPVAASIAYFFDQSIPKNFRLLLFDLGGGTLDICIFQSSKGNLEILTNCGDSNLGGRDFDKLLFDYFSKILKLQYGIDITSEESLKYRLNQKCVEIKHQLSVNMEATLDVNDISSKADGFEFITRLTFENLSSLLLNRIQNVIIESLASVKKPFVSKDIDKVLLVGGGCRMPMIRELLKKMFINAEHSCNENPDEIVAIGAAYYAHYLKTQGGPNCSVM